jgi:hypothetical protein
MSETVKARDNRGRWQKGCKSPNAGGRPKLPRDVLEIANAACPDAIRRAIELIRHKDPRIALKAIEIVLNRGLGMPRQAVDVTQTEPAVIVGEPMTVEQWVERFGPQTPVNGAGD